MNHDEATFFSIISIMVINKIKEWATNSSSPEESIAAITARILNRQARVCQLK